MGKGSWVYSERDGLELVLRTTVTLMDDNLETRQMLHILFNHQSTRNVHYTILSGCSICTNKFKKFQRFILPPLTILMSICWYQYMQPCQVQQLSH
jgi:hypothetical protein